MELYNFFHNIMSKIIISLLKFEIIWIRALENRQFSWAVYLSKK